MYNRTGELLEVDQKANFKAKMGRFLDCFTGKNQLLFHESKLFHHSIQYLKITVHPRWEVRQIMKIVIFSVKPLITSTCRNSLIYLETIKFYFGILIGIANEQAVKV